MKKSIKKLYKSLHEKVLQELSRMKKEDLDIQNNKNQSQNGEENGNQQQKIPSFFLLLLDFKKFDQLEIFEEHMKDPDVKKKLKIALSELTESYKASQDIDFAITFLKNIKYLTQSFLKKKWGIKFIKKSLIPYVFQIIIMTSESQLDQFLIDQALQSLNQCLGQNLSLTDLISDQTQVIFKLQKSNEQNRFYFNNVLPSLKQYLEFEQKQFLVDIFIQQCFTEQLPEFDFKNVGEYLPTIKQMISPLQYYLKDLSYFKKIDDEMMIRIYDLVQMGANALFLKRVYQNKYFKSFKIHATHYIQGQNQIKIEKEEIINKIKQEGEHCFTIYKILIKLIEQLFEEKTSNAEYKQKLILPMLECIFFYYDNTDLKEYKFKREQLNFFIQQKKFIEMNLSSAIPLLFQNYSRIFTQIQNFDYIEYFTKYFIPISKLINLSTNTVSQIFEQNLSSEPQQVKTSIYWLNQMPQFKTYMQEQKSTYDKNIFSKLIERIFMRKPQLHIEDQKRINEKQLLSFLPNQFLRPRQEFLDELYTEAKQKSISKNWREREEAVMKYKDLISFMDIRSLFVQIVPDFFDLCSDKIAEVRTVAAWQVDSLFARLPPRSHASNIFYQALIENVYAFYNSCTYQLRQVFVVMCASLMQKNSRIYLSYFQQKFLSLTKDRVTNVRISVAKTIAGHIQNKQPLYQHITTRRLISILKKDKNKDVKSLIADYAKNFKVYDIDDDLDIKSIDNSSHTQLNKNEVDQFTNGTAINTNLMLSSDTDIDPFDILLTDSSPQTNKNHQRKTSIDQFGEYYDEKHPTINQFNPNEDQVYPQNEQKVSIFDDLHEDYNEEEHDKIANIIEKKVQQEEKWPEQSNNKQTNNKQINQPNQTNQNKLSNSQTFIDLLDDLDDMFSDYTSNPINQSKMHGINNLSSQEMIQTTN